MNPIRGSFWQSLLSVVQRIDPGSLQFRLTVGVTLMSIVGVGSLAFWTAWKTQDILIASQRQLIRDVADRFPRDVELYRDMMTTDVAIQRAIDNRTLPGLSIVVGNAQGIITAHSTAPWQNEALPGALMSLSTMGWNPKIYAWDGRYFVLCKGSLVVDGQPLGQLLVAQEVTQDQLMFQSVLQALAIATGLTVVIVTLGIAWYVKRSLRPLRRVSQLTQQIDAHDLGHVKLQLGQAPTEVTELVQTWEEMLMRLSESWEQQRQFVNDVSHELRTPLTVVSGYLQSTLRRCNTLTDPQREALEIAASEAERTIQMLQDMLELARADSGSVRLTLEWFCLNDLVMETANMAETCSDRPILLEVETADIQIRTDRNRLKQVLLNLLDNALKYSDPTQPVRVKLMQAEGHVTIQVCDRGCGIPLHHQSRIFDRFYRVDEARARSTGGCGLGLAIVKTLVEAMGGNVAISSQPGEGSVFTVMLPTPGMKP